MKETIKTLSAHIYAVLVVALICYSVYATATNHVKDNMIEYMQKQIQSAQSETIKALDRR